MQVRGKGRVGDVVDVAHDSSDSCARLHIPHPHPIAPLARSDESPIMAPDNRLTPRFLQLGDRLPRSKVANQHRARVLKLYSASELNGPVPERCDAISLGTENGVGAASFGAAALDREVKDVDPGLCNLAGRVDGVGCRGGRGDSYRGDLGSAACSLVSKAEVQPGAIIAPGHQ